MSYTPVYAEIVQALYNAASADGITTDDQMTQARIPNGSIQRRLGNKIARFLEALPTDMPVGELLEDLQSVLQESDPL